VKMLTAHTTQPHHAISKHQHTCRLTHKTLAALQKVEANLQTIPSCPSFGDQATPPIYLERPSKAHQQLKHGFFKRQLWRSYRVWASSRLIPSSADAFQGCSPGYESRRSGLQEPDPDAITSKRLFWQPSRSDWLNAARPTRTTGPSFSTSAMLHSVFSLHGCSTAISGTISTNKTLSSCSHRLGTLGLNTIFRHFKTQSCIGS
jgi:hypothetical protein